MSTSGIDPSVRSAREIFRQSGLTPFREVLTPAVFQTVSPSPRHPSTVLVPEVVFWLMALVALGHGVMADAVRALWLPLTLPHLSLEPLTDAAFCTARNKLPVAFFHGVFTALVNAYARTFGERYRWRGFRLLGIDGSLVSLPSIPLLRRLFAAPGNQHGPGAHPQARLVALVGLWSGVCHDFVWSPLARSEQDAARRLVRHVGPQDLVLADCNFPSYDLMARLRARGTDFLMRLQGKHFRAGRRLPLGSKRSDEYRLRIRRPRGADPALPAQLDVRVLEYQIPGFRPARLITSLNDPQTYALPDLVALYHERWRHETIYREWKHTLELTNLRSHTPQGLYKEVLVQLTLNNAVRWIQAQAAGPDRRPVELRFRATVRLLRAAVGLMATAPPVELPRLWRQILDAIAKEQIRVRPGRSYPRPHDERPRNKGQGKLVQPARLSLDAEIPHGYI